MAALLLVGCASSGVKFSEMAGTLPPPAAGQGRVYVYRTSAVGAALRPQVTFDGRVVGKAIPKGFFYVDAAAGSHEIQTSTEVTRKLSLTLEPGQVRYVRLDVSMGFAVGHINPTLVDPAAGAKGIASCHHTTPEAAP